MDLLMVVTLQSYRWIDEDQAERTFGERGAPLIQAIRALRVEHRLEKVPGQPRVDPVHRQRVKD